MENLLDYIDGALAAICYFIADRMLSKRIKSGGMRFIVSFAITTATFIIIKLCFIKFA